MKNLKSFFLFIVAAVLGSGLALGGSFLFIKKSKAQTGVAQTPPPPQATGSAAASTPQVPPPMPGVPNMGQGAGGAANEAVWIYDPTNKRDPFRPYKTFRTEAPKKDKKIVEEKLDPLQKVDLTKISLIGILWEVKNPRALIKDQDGNIYTIHKSSRIGRRNGYVAVIREGEIVVVESNEEDGKMINESHVFELKKGISPSGGGI